MSSRPGTAVAQLQARIEHAASPRISPPPLPTVAQSISGKIYRMDANSNGWTTTSLTFAEGSAEAEVTINGTEQLPVGLDNVYRTTSNNGVSEALRGRWEGDDTCVIDDQKPGDFMLWEQYRLTFTGDQLFVQATQMPTGAMQSVTGHLAH